MILQKILKITLLSFMFILAVVVVFFGVQWFSSSVENLLIHKNSISANLQGGVDNASASILPTTPTDKNNLPLRNWQIENPDLQVRAAVSVEIGGQNSKILLSKNEQQKMPVASLTKMMTALVVLHNYDLSKNVWISPAAMAQEGEQGVLKEGQILSAKDLLYVALIESSNRAAYALAQQIGTEKFIALMNANAQKLGLTNTYFADVTGLSPASYSTAQDLAKLTQYLFANYPLFKEITGLKEYDVYMADGTLHHKAENTNQLLGQSNIISGKTGFTAEAKGCFMVVQQSPQTGNYIINIILGADDRFLEMQKLMDWVNQAYKW